MDAIPLEDDLFSIGITCCGSDTTAILGSMQVIERNAAASVLQPTRKARISSRMPSAKDLMSSFTKKNSGSRRKSVDVCIDATHALYSLVSHNQKRITGQESSPALTTTPSQKNSYPRRNSLAGYASAEQAAQLAAANEQFGRRPEPELFTARSPMDENEEDYGDDRVSEVSASRHSVPVPSLEDALASVRSQHEKPSLEDALASVRSQHEKPPLEDALASVRSQHNKPSLEDVIASVRSQNQKASLDDALESVRFQHTKPSVQDALALEVGLTAHTYLEECFYAEVSVLDREKFNAIPEIVKSDFTVKRHLGKGSFSDVFEVVCADGQLQAKLSNPTISRGNPEPPERRRPMRGKRSTLSSSINIAGLSRPLQIDEHKPVFAMKCLRPQIRSDAVQFTIGAEDLVHETAILANLNHCHIIKLYGRASGKLTDAFVLNDGYFILLDRLTGTLNDRIDEWKRSPKCILLGPTVKQIEIAQSIADALAYLHSKKIVFRDLKPDNVGFDTMGVLKLFDFGFAVGLPEEDEENPASLLFDRCGTPRYMATEVALSLGYGLSVDVYSFGMLLWEVCALAKPFSSVATAMEFRKTVHIRGKRPAIKDHWPKRMKELLRRCWSATPSKRPSVLDVKSSIALVMADITGEKRTPMKNVSRMTRRRSDVPMPALFLGK